MMHALRFLAGLLVMFGLALIGYVIASAIGMPDYAEAYLSILRNRLTRALRRTPSDADMLAAWSMGFNGYSRAGFDLNRTAKHIQRKAKSL